MRTGAEATQHVGRKCRSFVRFCRRRLDILALAGKSGGNSEVAKRQSAPGAETTVRGELVIVVVLLSSGCVRYGAASASPTPAASGGAGPVTGCAAAAGSAGSSVITAAELGHTGGSNLYDAIRRLRPAFFIRRGPTSINNEPAVAMVVIVNRRVVGGLDELRSMGATDLVCVRRLAAAEVYLITGTSPPDGGIELVRGR